MCMYDWQVSRDTCQEPEPADADDADAKALSCDMRCASSTLSVVMWFQDRSL